MFTVAITTLPLHDFHSRIIRVPTLVSDNPQYQHLAMEPLCLPDLEERTLARFDELATKGKIFYEPAVSELITVDGFDVSWLFNFPISIALIRSLIQETNIFCNPEASTDKEI
jgi:hypothetical protein